jgi:hypothetical protein
LPGDGSPSIPVLPFTEESLGSAYRDLSQFIRSFRNLFTDLIRHAQPPQQSTQTRMKRQPIEFAKVLSRCATKARETSAAAIFGSSPPIKRLILRRLRIA